MNAKEDAIAVVYEIIKQAQQDESFGKTKLFKAFYHSHYIHMKKTRSNLTEWPIIRMFYGPGIHEYEDIINTMIDNSLIEKHAYPNFSGNVRFKYNIKNKTLFVSNLTPDKKKSITMGVRKTQGASAAKLSSDTHKKITWKRHSNGETINIVEDVIFDTLTRSKDLQSGLEGIKDYKCEKKLSLVLEFAFKKYKDQEKIKYVFKYQKDNKVRILAEITAENNNCFLMEELCYLEYDIQEAFPELDIDMSFLPTQMICDAEKEYYQRM